MSSARRRRTLLVERHGRGGVSACTWALSGELAARGLDVTLLSPKREPLPVVGAPVRVLELLPGTRAGVGRARMLLRLAGIALVTVLVALGTRSHSVVMAVTEIGGVDDLLIRILRLLRFRVVLVAHNVVGHDEGTAMSPRGRDAYSRADAVVVLCEAERDRLLAEVESVAPRTYVIPHGEFRFLTKPVSDAAHARHRLGFDTDVPLVLFYGRLQPYKGLDLLVDALAELDARGLAAGAIIAGEPGPIDVAALEARIAANGLSDRVVLMPGYVTTETTGELFAAADCVALPYRHATQSGVTPLAFGYGRPVVVTDVGGLPEYIDAGSTGEIARPDDPEAFADALERVLAQPEELEDRKRRLLEDPPERFEWSSIAARFEPLVTGS